MQPRATTRCSAAVLSLLSHEGHLLGDAVDVAATEEDLASGDADDLTVGEEPGRGLERGLVGALVEAAGDHPAVGQVEFHVAGGQAVAGPPGLRLTADGHAGR